MLKQLLKKQTRWSLLLLISLLASFLLFFIPLDNPARQGNFQELIIKNKDSAAIESLLQKNDINDYISLNTQRVWVYNFKSPSLLSLKQAESFFSIFNPGLIQYLQKIQSFFSFKHKNNLFNRIFIPGEDYTSSNYQKFKQDINKLNLFHFLREGQARSVVSVLMLLLMAFFTGIFFRKQFFILPALLFPWISWINFPSFLFLFALPWIILIFLVLPTLLQRIKFRQNGVFLFVKTKIFRLGLAFGLFFLISLFLIGFVRFLLIVLPSLALFFTGILASLKLYQFYQNKKTKRAFHFVPILSKTEQAPKRRWPFFFALAAMAVLLTAHYLDWGHFSSKGPSAFSEEISLNQQKQADLEDYQQFMLSQYALFAGNENQSSQTKSLSADFFYPEKGSLAHQKRLIFNFDKNWQKMINKRAVYLQGYEKVLLSKQTPVSFNKIKTNSLKPLKILFTVLFNSLIFLYLLLIWSSYKKRTVNKDGPGKLLIK